MTEPENFDVCFCVTFDLRCQSFISGKQTGHYVLPQFLGHLKVLSCLAIRGKSRIACSFYYFFRTYMKVRVLSNLSYYTENYVSKKIRGRSDEDVMIN